MDSTWWINRHFFITFLSLYLRIDHPKISYKYILHIFTSRIFNIFIIHSVIFILILQNNNGKKKKKEREDKNHQNMMNKVGEVKLIIKLWWYFFRRNAHTSTYKCMRYMHRRSGILLYFLRYLMNDAFKFNWAKYFSLLMMWLRGKIS